MEPNPIDFATVLVELKRLGETGNVAVLTAILVALLLYLIVAVFARRSDKRDAKKVSHLRTKICYTETLKKGTATSAFDLRMDT